MIDKINKSFILLLSQNILLIQIFKFMLNEQLQKIKQEYQKNNDAIDFYFDASLPSVSQGLQQDNQRLFKNAREIMIDTKQITGNDNLLLIENQIVFDFLNY